MNFKCSCCEALHFEAEQTGGDKHRYTNCCGKGKVAVPLSTNYSDEIQQLYSGNTRDSKEFLKTIRQYNNNFAFASVQSNVEGLPSKGIYSYQINGQLYHHIGGALPQPGRPEKYGQLYFVDVEEAIVARQRLNVNLSVNTLQLLERFVRSSNPYAQDYLTMREVRESEMRQACEEDRDPMDVVMVFPESNAYTRGGVHQLPPPAAAGEIAVIFVEDPEQRFLRHGYISVSCHRRKFKTIPLDSIHLDPMCYPLLFLYGERGHPQSDINGIRAVYHCSQRSI